MIVRGDAAHVVVHGRQDRDRLLGHIHAGENLGRLRDTRQALVQDLRIQVIQVQEDVVLVRTHAATLADFDGHGARDHVARGQVLHGRRIALHEALAFRVGQITALAARALGDQTAGAIDAGRVELHELHVLQRQAGAQHHRIAVAGAGVGRGGAEIGAAVSAGRQYHHLGAELVKLAVVELQRRHAGAGAVLHDQVQREIFDEELHLAAHRLAVQGVQDGVAGAVGGGAGALHRAFAEVAGHAAEGALIDLAFFGAAEGHAPVFQLIDGLGRVADQIFDRVLIAQPVRPLDGVVHMPLPAVLAHVAERGGDAALRRDGVRAGGEDLGHAGDLQPLLGGAERGAKARAPGADDDDVVFVIDQFVSGHQLIRLRNQRAAAPSPAPAAR